jgi:transcriptional regulator with XRE-family HTH domain
VAQTQLNHTLTMKKKEIFLRDLRNELGHSQETMADEMGISQPAYWNMENGKKKIDMEDIEKIAKATGKDKTEVFQKLNGMTIENTINNAHDNHNVVNIIGDDWCKLLLEEKDKRILEKDFVNQEQRRYIEYLEDKLKNVGLL